MANPRGVFDETAFALGWFDETAQAIGWFDGDLLGPDAGGSVSQNYGVAIEQNAAFAPTQVESASYGVAIENDSAFALPQAGVNQNYGVAVENNSAFAPAASERQPYGIAVENNSALAPASRETQNYGLVQENNTAFAPSQTESQPYGVAIEQDTAYALPQGGISQNYGVAIENDTAYAPSFTLGGGQATGGGGPAHARSKGDPFAARSQLAKRLLQEFPGEKQRLEALAKLPKIAEPERVAVKKAAQKLANHIEFGYEDLEEQIQAALVPLAVRPIELHIDWTLYFLRVEAHRQRAEAESQEEMEIALAMMML